MQITIIILNVVHDESLAPAVRAVCVRSGRFVHFGIHLQPHGRHYLLLQVALASPGQRTSGRLGLPVSRTPSFNKC